MIGCIRCHGPTINGLCPMCDRGRVIRLSQKTVEPKSDTPKTNRLGREYDLAIIELTEAWHLLNVLSLNMMDDDPTWPRVLDWLKRNESFKPQNKLDYNI